MDFRNITNLADHESLPESYFADHESLSESYFPEEDFQDFESWNPVSIDYLIQNNEQYQDDDARVRSLGILDSAPIDRSLSADSEEHLDFRDDQMRGVWGNTTHSIDPTLEWPGKLMLSGRLMKSGNCTSGDFRDDVWQDNSADNQYGSLFWTDGSAYLSSSKPTSRPPTCYAPLFPIVHMSTHFQTHFGLELAVPLIEETLKEKEVSFNFIASECAWKCSYLNNTSHGSFDVRIYRFFQKVGQSQPCSRDAKTRWRCLDFSFGLRNAG